MASRPRTYARCRGDQAGWNGWTIGGGAMSRWAVVAVLLVLIGLALGLFAEFLIFYLEGGN